MSIQSRTIGIPDNLLVEMQEAASRADQGIRDREVMRQAIESLNRLREEIRQRHGLLDIAVPALRELRDS
jgi:hypothetical protein